MSRVLIIVLSMLFVVGCAQLDHMATVPYSDRNCRGKVAIRDVRCDHGQAHSGRRFSALDHVRRADQPLLGKYGI